MCLYVYMCTCGTIWVRTRFNNIINNFMAENVINLHNIILKRNRYDKQAYTYSDISVNTVELICDEKWLFFNTS